MLLRLLLLAMIVALCGCSHCSTPCLTHASCHGGLDPPEGIHPLDVR